MARGERVDGSGAYASLNDTNSAIKGVKEAGATLEQLYEKQGQTAKKALDEQTKGTGALQKSLADAQKEVANFKAKLDSISEHTVKRVELKADVDQARSELSEISRQLNALRDKTITVTTRHVEARSAGGPVGFARGGTVPGGWGGGDKVRALLEAGEYILRKEAVRHYGLEWIEAMNQMRLPLNMPRFAQGGMVSGIRIPQIPRVAFARGGAVTAAATEVIRLDFFTNNHRATSVTVPRDEGLALVRTLQEWRRGLGS